MAQIFDVAQNPNDKLWYVVGKAGRYWMPVSDGYQVKADAIKKLDRTILADRAAKRELLGLPDPKPGGAKMRMEDRLRKIRTVKVIPDTRGAKDQRYKVDLHIVEYRDENNQEYRKSFAVRRGEQPNIPESGTHNQLNALSEQHLLGGFHELHNQNDRSRPAIRWETHELATRNSLYAIMQDKAAFEKEYPQYEYKTEREPQGYRLYWRLKPGAKAIITAPLLAAVYREEPRVREGMPGYGEVTPNEAKKLVKLWLSIAGLPDYKLSAKTTSFSDLARASMVFVTVHTGFLPENNPGWQNIKRLAKEHGFGVEFGVE